MEVARPSPSTQALGLAPLSVEDGLAGMVRSGSEVVHASMVPVAPSDAETGARGPR